MKNYEKIFIYSGFVVAVVMIIMGLVLMFFSDSKNFQTIPVEIVGGIMIAWGSFRGYKSWVAYKQTHGE